MERSFIKNLNKTEISVSEKQYYLEKYILYNLKKSFQSTGETLFTEYIISNKESEATRFDAVIPRDWKGLKGPIIVEIKNEIKKESFEKITQNINRLSSSNIKTFLIIVNKDFVDSIDFLDYQNTWNQIIGSKIKLVIWDTNKLNENILARFNDLEEPSYSELEKSSYKDAITQKNNKNIEEENIGLLKNSFKSEKVVLFLGSGVSKEYELPLWEELIQGLSNNVINIIENLHYLEKDMLNKELSNLLGSNPILAANYLESGILNNSSTLTETNEVKNKFYPQLQSVLYQKYKSNSYPSTQLKYLAKGIIESYNKNGIQKVITYNYDDLLQQELNKTDESFKFQTVFERPSADINDFPIYHVHGFLPKDEKLYPNYKMEDQELIFTEESYFKLQKNEESWRNNVQVEALKNHTVIMLGLSLNDPNLRRLLIETRQSTETKNYILLRSASKNDSEYLSVLEEEVSSKFLTLHHQILEGNFKKLGVEVLWYENHGDVAGILKQIFS